jgi:cytochrome c5
MHKTVWTLLFTLAASNAWATTAEETYKAVCSACHTQGLAGAPKLGDAKAWGKLIKEGQVNLSADGYLGVRGMPARGGRADLTVAQFANTVVYMANQAGGNWREPDEAMLKKMNARIDKRSAAKK